MMPHWRSILFVPATAGRFIDKADQRGADALYLDLEDAVAAEKKPAARAAVRAAAARMGARGTPVLVRINRPWRMAMADIEASVWPEVAGLLLPKVETARDVRIVEEIVAELEAERGIAAPLVFNLLIETPGGLANAREIAHASPRIRVMTLGGEDFADAMGMPDPDPETLIPFMQQVQLAAREAGILAHGYPDSIANHSDLERFRDSAMRARRMGFDGGSCIHPAQVPVLNEAFSPSAEELVEAAELVAAYDAALARGEGAITYRGKMVDVPVANRARRLLALRDRLSDG